MIDRQFKGKLKCDKLLWCTETGRYDKIAYVAGTDVIVIGQTDGATTLNTGGLAFCCLMPDGNVENIQDDHILVDVESFGKQAAENISKREHFAGLAMSRMAHSNMDDDSYTSFEEIKRIAHLSTLYADALLEELVKTDKTEQ